MLRIAYFTAPERDENGICNIGDKIILEGVRNLVRHAIGEHAEEVHYLGGRALNSSGIDVLIICGMPQVANTRRASAKVDQIVSLAESNVPVRINIGVGSFYFDAFGGSVTDKDLTFAGAISASPAGKLYARYASFDLCTCRDFGAAAALSAVGVKNLALPCPGFFAALFQPRPLFRRSGPVISVLNGASSFWNRVDADVHEFYKDLASTIPDCIFLAHDEQDCAMLSELNIPYVFFNSVGRFLAFLASADRLLSLRVHGALPAWALGLDVTLLGIDRRALIGADFDLAFRVVPLRNRQDFLTAKECLQDGARVVQSEDVRRLWLLRYIEQYSRAIREVLICKLGTSGVAAVRSSINNDLERATVPLGFPGYGYFSRFFNKDKRVVEVKTTLLRSMHAHSHTHESLEVKIPGGAQTVSFGPYLLLTQGMWKAMALVRITPGDLKDHIPNEVRLMLRIMKGIPGKELALQVRQPDILSSNTFCFELEFVNPSDTGAIETVFSVKGLAQGGVVSISNVSFVAP